MDRRRLELFLTGALFLLAIIWLWRYGAGIKAERVREVVSSFGILAPFIFIILNILSVVIAPIPGFPFWFAGLALFGFPVVALYVLIADTLGGIIAFLIARKFGRPAVTGLVGERSMAKVDQFSEEVGWQMLFMTRLLMGQLFDFISYGAGFTLMSLKVFSIVTFLGSAPPVFITFYLFDWAAGDLAKIGGLAALGYLLMLVPPAWVYWKKKFSNQS